MTPCKLTARAWNEFQDGELKPGLATIQAGDGIVEIPGLSTNGADQWGLAAIQNLALVPPD